MTYALTLEDRTVSGTVWLVALVNVNGPATIVGRWETQAAADADALRWMALEGSVS